MPAAVAPVVPAILVAGFRQPDRIAVIGALLAARPDGERWAVVGSGIGAPAPYGHDKRWVTVEHVPGGCACCAGAVPFRVGLTRLLRRMAETPPARLIIEGGDQGHVANLRAQLTSGGFGALLDLQCVVATLDCAQVQPSNGAARAALADLVGSADFLVLDAQPKAASFNPAGMLEAVAQLDARAHTILGTPGPESAGMILEYRLRRQ